jgi:glycosyltransferase involved in cell wall biosynthesis
MSRSRTIARQILDRVPALEKSVIDPLRRERRRRKLRRLADVGLVDVAFVASQAPRPIASRRDALRFLSEVNNSFSPHPLIEPRWISSRVGGRDWLATILDPAAPQISLGPVFDAAGLPEAERGETLAHSLAAFVEAASPDTILPLPDGTNGPITMGEALQMARQLADERAATADYVARRGSHHWDAAAERAYIESHHAVADRWDAPRHGGPAVSVVMPVYNREDVVSAAIDSVIAQTFTSWELVIVDDGSTDGTAEVVRGYSARDPRVRLVTGAHEGVSAARNVGIRESRAEILAFIDSDNQWTPHLLALSLDEILGDRADLVHSAIEIDKGGEAPTYLGMSGTVDHLLHGNSFVDMNTLVVKKSLVLEVGMFDESLRRWVDYDLFIRLFMATDRVSYLPFIGVRYDHRDDAVDRITTSESPHWRDIVLGKYLVDWEGAARTERVAGRTSVVVTTTGQWEWPVRAIDAVLANSDDLDVEVVVVIAASSREVPAIIASRYVRHPRLNVIVNRGGLKRPLANNIGFAATTGERVVFLERTVEVRPGWLPPLLDALADPGVFAAQPVPLGPGGAVRHAGIVFGGPGVLPVRYLAEHPMEDVRSAGQTTFHAVGDGGIAVRAEHFLAIRGFDATFQGAFEDADLCLRASRELGTTNVVVPESTIAYLGERGRWVARARAANADRFETRWGATLPDELDERYKAAGLEIVDRFVVDPEAARPEDEPDVTGARNANLRLRRLPRTVESGPFAGRPALRWAIKIASPAEPRGDNWGDTFFADEIRRALERLGQEVVVDRVRGHVRPTSYLDDVVLSLRGLATVWRQDDATNVLWVISHPDRVVEREVVDKDIVYAASTAWSAHATSAFGRTVKPLLQATDPNLFNPDRAEPGSGPDVLFVGTTRKIFRPIVRMAMEAGGSPTIYGHGWEEFLPAEMVAGTSMPRPETGAAYRSSGVVLNDHWDDMATWGFLSNRLFDGVASGARMISDRAVGIEEVFGDVVTVVTSTDEMRQALAEVHERVTEDDVIAASEMVRRDHSFDARAHTLITDVYAFRGAEEPSDR